MKLGNNARLAAFLVYEYKNVNNFGKIISLNDDGEMRYIVFEDGVNQGQTINVVFSDINLLVFYNAYNTVENLTQEWREFNKKHNPEIYEKHMKTLVDLQKGKEQKNSFVIEIDELIK